VCRKRLCGKRVGGKRECECECECESGKGWMERMRESSNGSFEAADMSDVGGVWLWVCAPPRLGRPFPISTSDPPTQTRTAVGDLMWRVRKLGSDLGGTQRLKATQSNGNARTTTTTTPLSPKMARTGSHPRTPSQCSQPNHIMSRSPRQF
jgi:hypothetical protein